MGAVPNGLVTMSDQSLTEGNSGSANMTFTVTLASAQSRGVRFDYRTENGTGTAGVDYTQTRGAKTITAGQTTTTIDVPILGDTDVESDETFTLHLDNFRFV